MGFSLVERTSESEESEGSMVAFGNASASLPGVVGAPLPGGWFLGFQGGPSLRVQAGQDKRKALSGWEVRLGQRFPDLWSNKPSLSNYRSDVGWLIFYFSK